MNTTNCVCGSGKLTKDCHRDLNPKGPVYLLWEKYLSLDTEVQRLASLGKVKSFCGDCNQCCSDYFYISATEYFLIKHELLRILGQVGFDQIIQRSLAQLASLERDFPAEYEKLGNKNDGSPFYDTAVRKFKPCPMLDEDGRCMIYRARPLVCRLLGTSYLYATCEVIKAHLSHPVARLWRKETNIMVGVAYDENFKHNVDYFTTSKGVAMIQRSYPLCYFLANDKLFETNYQLAVTGTSLAYADAQLG